MNESKNSADQDNVVQGGHTDPATINLLISDLGTKDGSVRIKARQSLVAIGDPAVACLVEALSDPNELVRSEAAKALGQINVAWGSHADSATISALVADLGSKDGLVRVRARNSLVAIGEQAVSLLVKALASKQQWVRWEVAKALGQIGSPASAQALVRALEDDMFDVRWLAAEGLIVMGREALVPLLHALVECSDSEWLREGAHHMLHDLARGRPDLKDILQPVLAALEDVEPSLEVPVAAEAVLDKLIRGEG
jgi:HEAT repeat protein